MFIEIDTKEQLIDELRKRLYEEVNIHYICEECDSELVTGYITIYEDTINEIEKYNCLFVNLPCTNDDVCGSYIKFLEYDFITGIED